MPPAKTAAHRRLTAFTIVVLARHHNPSIATKDWLRSKGVVKGKIERFVNTPQFSVVDGKGYQVAVDNQRLQFTSTAKDPKRSIIRVSDAATQYVKALPETRYHAVGLNFGWETDTRGRGDVSSAMARFFGVDQKAVQSKLGCPVGLGYIVLAELDPFKLRLKLEPDVTTPGNGHYDLNYHAEVKSTRDLVKCLARARELLTHGASWVKIISGGV